MYQGNKFQTVKRKSFQHIQHCERYLHPPSNYRSARGPMTHGWVEGRISRKKTGLNIMRVQLVLSGGNKNENLVVGVVHDSHPSVVFWQ